MQVQQKNGTFYDGTAAGNKYAYCHSNPINGVDPTGKFTAFEGIFVIGLLLVAIVVGLLVNDNY